MVSVFFKKHFSVKYEKVGSDKFEGQLFFSHDKTNSCGVAIGFVGIEALNILNMKCDNFAGMSISGM